MIFRKGDEVRIKSGLSLEEAGRMCCLSTEVMTCLFGNGRAYIVNWVEILLPAKGVGLKGSKYWFDMNCFELAGKRRKEPKPEWADRWSKLRR